MLFALLRLPAGHGIGQHHLLLGKIGHAKLLAATLLPKVIVSRIDRQAV